MTKVELIAAVAATAGLTKKDAEKAVSATLDVITEALQKGDKVSLVGFGTFEVRERKERQGRNPQTREPMTIPASKLPAFSAGKALKDRREVNLTPARSPACTAGPLAVRPAGLFCVCRAIQLYEALSFGRSVYIWCAFGFKLFRLQISVWKEPTYAFG